MSSQYPSTWHPPPLTGLIDVRAHNFLLALQRNGRGETVNIREIFLEWEDVAKLVQVTCNIGQGRCYSRVHWDHPDDDHVPGLGSLLRYLCSLGLNIPQEDVGAVEWAEMAKASGASADCGARWGSKGAVVFRQQLLER